MEHKYNEKVFPIHIFVLADFGFWPEPSIQV
jgi:hypothetical protein